MYIGKVSKLTRATPKAIRLYEKMGLIPIPSRKGKYRDYNDNDIDLIKIIKEAQRLGFKLSEIRDLSSASTSCEEFPWEKSGEMAQKKILTIHSEITKLNKLSNDLKLFLDMLKNRKCTQ